MLRVLGLGDNCVDIYIDSGIMYPGGNSLNFCAYAAQAGADPEYMGVIGNDAESRVVLSALNQLRIKHDKCHFREGITTRCVISLVNGDRVIKEETFGKTGAVMEHPITLGQEELDYIKGFDIVHTSCFSCTEKQLYKIKEAGVPLVFDFSDLWDEEYLKRVCPHVTMSFLSCGHLNNSDAEKILIHCLELGSKTALATTGERGAIFYNGRKFYRKAPYQIQSSIVDTLGAGDAFLASFLLGYFEGKQFESRMTEVGTNLKLRNADHEDFEDYLIDQSLSRGNLHATRTCMVNGAFGYGVPIQSIE